MNAFFRRWSNLAVTCFAVSSVASYGVDPAYIDFGGAQIFIRENEDDGVRLASRLLQEEIFNRTAITLPIVQERPSEKNYIQVMGGRPYSGISLGLRRRPNGQESVVVFGKALPDFLYGIGAIIRKAELSAGKFGMPASLKVESKVAYSIRGHQLGYRARANSYDAWGVEEYERYIRELALWGANAIENIPFQDDQPSPHMPIPRDEMNVKLSEICQKYDMQYWVWTPADFDLNDAEKRLAVLEKHEALYAACPRLDAVFFPGGDPGDNPPELVMPFLEDVAVRLREHHPSAKVWLSMQGFNREETDFVYAYLDKNFPGWFGGLVAGPSSPPIPLTRERLGRQYQLRDYPDITHTVRCQYEAPWWDQAFALTLGREPINPRPMFYAHVQDWYGPYTDGFIAYSDGVHDDVNKFVMLAKAWDPKADVRQVLIEYCRFFFGGDVAEAAADGILMLEKNWEGSLAANASVEGTLSHWEKLEEQAPGLRDNWRWQMLQLRAAYDAYTRRRLLYETALEQEANEVMRTIGRTDVDAAIEQARVVLTKAETEPISPELRRRIEALCDALFESIGLQTSMAKHQASGAERGCILDFVDYPLNNRWWLEDEFRRFTFLPTEELKQQELLALANWETPEGVVYYDDIGNVGKSPHVVRGGGYLTNPSLRGDPTPSFAWWDNGMSRKRLSWQCYMDWPIAVKYPGLDPKGTYVIRLTGYRDALLRIDGERVEPRVDGRGIGEIKEFRVPWDAHKDGEIVITFDRPDERHLNWREHSRVTEMWLIRRDTPRIETSPLSPDAVLN